MSEWEMLLFFGLMTVLFVVVPILNKQREGRE
jgi:hypothetical protein